MLNETFFKCTCSFPSPAIVHRQAPQGKYGFPILYPKIHLYEVFLFLSIQCSAPLPLLVILGSLAYETNFIVGGTSIGVASAPDAPSWSFHSFGFCFLVGLLGTCLVLWRHFLSCSWPLEHARASPRDSLVLQTLEGFFFHLLQICFLSLASTNSFSNIIWKHGVLGIIMILCPLNTRNFC